MQSVQDSRKIEDAIKYVSGVYKHRHNPKPVLLHSIRVGIYLFDVGCDTSTVIAALLHDVLEDTDIKISDISDKFGTEVSGLVLALTLDESITDYKARYLENFTRMETYGQKAILIRAADLIDNSYYYHLYRDMMEKTIEKFMMFYERYSAMISEPQISKDLSDRFMSIKNL